MADTKAHEQEAAPAYTPSNESTPASVPEETTSHMVVFARCAAAGFVNRDKKSLKEGKRLKTRSDAITIPNIITYDQLMDRLMERGPDLDAYNRGTEFMRCTLLLLWEDNEVRVSDQESWAAGRKISGIDKGKAVTLKLLYCVVPNDYSGKEKKCTMM